MAAVAGPELVGYLVLREEDVEELKAFGPPFDPRRLSRFLAMRTPASGQNESKPILEGVAVGPTIAPPSGTRRGRRGPFG